MIRKIFKDKGSVDQVLKLILTPCVNGIAASWIMRRILYHVGLHRIQMNITSDLEQILVIINHFTFKTVLE